MQSVLSRPDFQSEEAAFAYVEVRLRPNGGDCVVDKHAPTD